MMNNDIWSVREEPLEVGKSLQLKNRIRPMLAEGSYILFINSRLKRAWGLKVTTRDIGGHKFRVKILHELRYAHVVSNYTHA